MDGVNMPQTISDVLTMFKEWKSKLSKEDKQILYEYSKYLYEEVNDFLREDILYDDSFGSSPDDFSLRNTIENIDEILDRFILNELILAYRNEYHEVSIEDLYEYLQGLDKIVYKNFVSTSITEEAFDRFFQILKTRHPDSSFLRIKGHLNIGISCGFIDSTLSAMSDQEDEILIARNVTFYIDESSIDINHSNKSVSINGDFRKE